MRRIQREDWDKERKRYLNKEIEKSDWHEEIEIDGGREYRGKSNYIERGRQKN